MAIFLRITIILFLIVYQSYQSSVGVFNIACQRLLVINVKNIYHGTSRLEQNKEKIIAKI
jgi:hypothetical protein